MASWKEFEAAAPGLAARVRERLEAHKHKTLATLRRDGSPRISGTEVQLADGELWIGSMWEALKALDLRRDPRYALHSGSDDPPGWRGDAKLAGVAEEILDEDEVIRRNGAELHPSHLFRLEIHSASTVAMTEDGRGVRIESWAPGRGQRVFERS